MHHVISILALVPCCVAGARCGGVLAATCAWLGSRMVLQVPAVGPEACESFRVLAVGQVEEGGGSAPSGLLNSRASLLWVSLSSASHCSSRPASRSANSPGWAGKSRTRSGADSPWGSQAAAGRTSAAPPSRRTARRREPKWLRTLSSSTQPRPWSPKSVRVILKMRPARSQLKKSSLSRALSFFLPLPQYSQRGRLSLSLTRSPPLMRQGPATAERSRCTKLPASYFHFKGSPDKNFNEISNMGGTTPTMPSAPKSLLMHESSLLQAYPSLARS